MCGPVIVSCYHIHVININAMTPITPTIIAQVWEVCARHLVADTDLVPLSCITPSEAALNPSEVP